MPRANRHFLPGHVSHAETAVPTFNVQSSRRNKQPEGSSRLETALSPRRRRYLRWVFEAKKRFGLSVLNFMVPSNHVHLLVKDTGLNGIELIDASV
jgi:putative transposase